MSAITAILQDLPSDAGARLRPLYERAEAAESLTVVDFYTIGDLLQLSGLEQVESLHALLLALFAAFNDGSPCVEATESALTEQLADLAGNDAATWAARIVKDLQRDAYAELVGHDVSDNKPLVCFRAGRTGFVYFQKFLKHEQAAWKLLQKRLGSQSIPCDPGTMRQALAAVLTATGPQKTLNAGQQFALGLALLRPLSVVSGGPGTGKTSIVGSLLRCLVRLDFPPERIALAAPTGRAAQRLTDAIHTSHGLLTIPLAEPDAALQKAELKATTLHQLLEYSPTSGRYWRHEENPLSYDVVIVDEASMVGLTLLAQLLRALPANARLVLLGDKDQLPSVEAGGWLAHWAPAEGGPAYSKELLAQLQTILPDLALPSAGSSVTVRDVAAVLQENYRSEKRIQELAAAVNRQDATALDRVPRLTLEPAQSESGNPLSSLANVEAAGGCWLLEPGTDWSAWRRVLQLWAEHHYLRKNEGLSFLGRARDCVLTGDADGHTTQKVELQRLFAVVESARILTLIREGPWGAAGINQMLASLLRPTGERGVLFPGALVLVTRNDHDRQLFNGDVGLALPTAEGGLRVVFPRRGEFVSYPAGSLPAHELAFALTVHKSQGSEYGQVLLVAPPEGGRRLLTKEIVYTGLTRAKAAAILCGPVEVFQAAFRRKMRRTTGVMIAEI